MARNSSAQEESGRQNGLTPIPGSIHWAATSIPIEPYVNERDEIDIDNFLDTLAQVALAIAARRSALQQPPGEA
jgi:hypothetical protein